MGTACAADVRRDRTIPGGTAACAPLVMRLLLLATVAPPTPSISTAFLYQMRHRYVKLLMQMIGGFQVMMIVGAVLRFIVGPLTKPVDFQTIYLGIVLIIVVVSTGVTRDV